MPRTSPDDVPRSGDPLAWAIPDDLDPLTSPADLPTTATSQTDETSDPTRWDGSDPDELDASGPASDAPTSSRASSGIRPFSKTSTQRASRQAVKMVGVVAHQTLARDEHEQAAGLYLTDDDDDRAIGDPVGSIVHRHGWLGEAGNPDVVDGINALIGLGIYAWKQVQRAAAARAAKIAARAGASAAAATGEPVDLPGDAAYGDWMAP